MNYFQRLKDLREDHDLSQEDIARLLNTTRQQISKYECGNQMMGVDKYIKLAQFYKISLDYLLGLTNDPIKLNIQNDQTNELLTEEHIKLITAYESKKDLQKAVKKLLDLK